MKKFFILPAACAVYLLGLVKLSHADCCPCTAGVMFDPVSLSPVATQCCDGTGCTPYCGYGPCNIFGCNCDVGCRTGSSCSSRSVLSSLAARTEDNSSDLFDTTDTNKDGKMTFDEWCNSAVRSTLQGQTVEKLEEVWAKYDTSNKGYLTKDEAIKRKA